MKLPGVKLCGNMMIVLFGLFILFHILVMLGIVPTEILWGGQLTESSSILVYEGIAILLLAVFALIIAMKVGHIKTKRKIFVDIGVWIIVVYFALNTLGNLAAVSTLEKLIFTPLTVLFTLLGLRLALARKN